MKVVYLCVDVDWPHRTRSSHCLFISLCNGEEEEEVEEERKNSHTIKITAGRFLIGLKYRIDLFVLFVRFIKCPCTECGC